jgi:hypothetical protein
VLDNLKTNTLQLTAATSNDIIFVPFIDVYNTT